MGDDHDVAVAVTAAQLLESGSNAVAHSGERFTPGNVRIVARIVEALPLRIGRQLGKRLAAPQPVVDLVERVDDLDATYYRFGDHLCRLPRASARAARDDADAKPAAG